MKRNFVEFRMPGKGVNRLIMGLHPLEKLLLILIAELAGCCGWV
jgi:hypothetical protein